MPDNTIVAPASPPATTQSAGVVPPPAAAPAPSASPSAIPGSTAGAPAGTGQSSVPAPTQNWYDSFQNPEVKNFLATKKFENAEVLADSYRNLEKLKGVPEDQLIKLPTDPASAEWNKVFERLGKPGKPEEYKIEAGAEAPGSKEFTEWAKNTFHKANLTQDQAKALHGEYNNYVKSLQDNQKAQMEAQAKAEAETLRKEWGNAYDQNINMAKAGAKTFGLDEAKINKIQQALGHNETVKLLQQIGSKMGEAQYVQGVPGGNGSLPPDVAKAEINMLLADPAFAKAYASGGAKEKAQLNKLYRDAYPGEMTI